MNYPLRLRRLRRAMEQHRVPSLLVTHLPDVRYLTGFTGSNAALAITGSTAGMRNEKHTVLFTDGRYTVQAEEEVHAAQVVIAQRSALNEACVLLNESGANHAFFDAEQTTVAAVEQMRAALGKKGRKHFFRPLPPASAVPLVMGLRLVKDADEQQRMRAAAALGVRLFEEILARMQPGMTEKAVAAELEYAARMAGAEAMSFDTIVASGARSALPHGHATDARLPRRGFVTLDFGVILTGYCSDMTRTVHMGRATDREREVYAAVLEAQESAVAAVRAGVSCGAVDEAARGVLRQTKLAQYFTHSTGHGVGLGIHEPPRIAAGQESSLKTGNVVTIEPGVYIPEEFGVRIEDTVVVEKTGCTVLTPATKALIEL
jgi:Xaa-Pro aminopeptidase